MEHQNEQPISIQPGQIVFLGHQGENLAKRVIFDLSGLRERYPKGHFALAVQRKGDSLPYPAARTNLDGDALVWTLTDADTAVAGYGRCELRCYDGEKLAKSEVWQTFTMPALSACGDTPEAWPDYVAQVQRIGEKVQEAQTRAPRIGESGTWLLWDAEAEQYADTGLPARGERGDPGPVPDSAWVQKSVSGSLIVLRDGAEGAPIPALTVSIPYTPGGVTALTLTTVGKNLWADARFADINWAQETEGDYAGYYRGTTGHLNDGVYGSGTAGFVPGIRGFGEHRVAVSLRRGGSSGALRAVFGYVDGEVESANMSADGRFTRVSEIGRTLKTVRLRSTAGASSTAQRIRDLQIEVGDAATDYEPYRGAVRTVSVPAALQPFYGGAFDAVTGLWTKTLDANGGVLSVPMTAQGEALPCQTLGGVNTISSDCGTVALSYCADATLTDSAKARKAMLACVEPGMTATRNYTVGELLIAGDTLYAVTTNIADGAELVPGVNISETTVTAQIALAAASGGGGSVTVDAALSAVSENPVQNKVIKAALDGKGTYSKPSGGIPASDLASGVIPTTASDVDAAPAIMEVTIQTSGDVIQALDAGKIYHFTGAVSALMLTLNPVSSETIEQYHFDFDSGSTAAVVSIPGVIWQNAAFSPKPNKHYEVDILNGYGVVTAW